MSGGDDEGTRTIDEPARAAGRNVRDATKPALVVVASSEAGRVGEVFLFPKKEHVVGRGGPKDDDPSPRALPTRQRPGKNDVREPLDSPFLSRVQLRVRRVDDALELENAGRCTLRDERGREVTETRLAVGDCVSLGDQIVLACVERPDVLARTRHLAAGAIPAFGEADASGIVGESVAAWRLRDAIAFLAGRSAHVLVLGPSGSGKEIAAQAIHLLSDRKTKRLVARNAATIPATLVEAELFGNAASYPNAGMPERPGLVGEAEGSTLFLDEIGELPEELQTKLLRLLDTQGDYQRLGDARRRRADLRFVGATNRDFAALRHDLAARLKLRITLPGLDERIEDIPLIARHLLRLVAKDDPEIGERFLDEQQEPRISCALARALVAHKYTANVRELESLLWVSISTSPESELDLTREVEDALQGSAPKTTAVELTAEEVKAALERAGGVRERAWRDLGLANRYVLKRLLKKYGLASD
jgi:two-component system nitrogen regulation response regulator GlnG/two-component system response regulator HydG